MTELIARHHLRLVPPAFVPETAFLMGRRRDTPDFIRSNKLSALKYQPSAEERELTGRLIASTSAHEREALGQKLLDNICRALKISRTRLRVSDERQPHKLRGGKLAYKLYGVYYCENACDRDRQPHVHP